MITTWHVIFMTYAVVAAGVLYVGAQDIGTLDSVWPTLIAAALWPLIALVALVVVVVAWAREGTE